MDLRGIGEVSGVSTLGTDRGVRGTEDFWLIVTARSENETEIRAIQTACRVRGEGHSTPDAEGGNFAAGGVFLEPRIKGGPPT